MMSRFRLGERLATLNDIFLGTTSRALLSTVEISLEGYLSPDVHGISLSFSISFSSLSAHKIRL